MTAPRAEEAFDIAFVGVGPVGLYGLYYAGLRMMKAAGIDMLGHVGGGLAALYPEKYIYDVAGFPRIMAKELVQRLRLQAEQYPFSLYLQQRVTSLRRRRDGLIELGTDKAEHLAQTVVICAGLGAYIPRTLDIPDLKRLEGRGVFYFVSRPEAFRGKRVLIVGGGDAAFDYALMLEGVAEKVTLIHRNDFFSAHEHTIEKVRASSVEMRYPSWELQAVAGADRVRQATVVNSRSGETVTLEIDALVLNIGFITNLGPIADWGLALEKNAIVVDSRMRTNIEGVFAAGDIVAYDGKLKLIATGFGEVAVAVNNAKNYIDPRARVSPGHSTDKHVLAQRKLARSRRESPDQERK